MSTRYLSDENGVRVGVLLDVEEYERLREIEDIRRFDEATVRIERGEADFLPWEEAKREIEAEREELGRRGELRDHS